MISSILSKHIIVIYILILCSSVIKSLLVIPISLWYYSNSARDGSHSHFIRHFRTSQELFVIIALYFLTYVRALQALLISFQISVFTLDKKILSKGGRGYYPLLGRGKGFITSDLLETKYIKPIFRVPSPSSTIKNFGETGVGKREVVGRYRILVLCPLWRGKDMMWYHF